MKIHTCSAACAIRGLMISAGTSLLPMVAMPLLTVAFCHILPYGTLGLSLEFTVKNAIHDDVNRSRSTDFVGAKLQWRSPSYKVEYREGHCAG
jgi:hypothetical protein